jgi:TetR/AcrR family transcriptional regulator of autoinduction and epiphytic fitness
MTPPMSPPEVDPRIERSRAVILEATLDELADVGYGAFTVEGVARRAGVSKATIYRHWAVQPPDTGDHRERIAGLLRGIAEMLAGSRFASCVPAVISAAQRDEGLRDFHHSSSAERRKFMVGMLDAARDAGHLDATIDTNLLAELLVAPIFFRRLMTPTPFPPSEVDRLLELVLDPHWH